MNEVASVEKPAVLVVDDEELVRSVLVDLLTLEGYRVQEAATAAAAWARLLAGDTGVVILDMGLGAGMSGPRLFRLIARQLPPPLPEVIFFSGMEDEQLARRSRWLGVEQWVRKGTAVQEILGAVQVAMEKRLRSPRQAYERTNALGDLPGEVQPPSPIEI